MKMSQLITLYFICLMGIFPVAAFAQSYTISGDGSEVADNKTGLIWRRCPEGMALSAGTCTGTATTFTHDAALQRATSQAGSLGWRLPNVKELSSIVDKSVLNPAIDTATFPATPPASVFWSSSPFVSTPSSAWVVDFGVGVVGGSSAGRNDINPPTYTGYLVRLVRGGL